MFVEELVAAGTPPEQVLRVEEFARWGRLERLWAEGTAGANVEKRMGTAWWGSHDSKSKRQAWKGT